jgi:hypothetical protein
LRSLIQSDFFPNTQNTPLPARLIHPIAFGQFSYNYEGQKRFELTIGNCDSHRFPLFRIRAFNRHIIELEDLAPKILQIIGCYSQCQNIDFLITSSAFCIPGMLIKGFVRLTLNHGFWSQQLEVV